MHTLIWEPRGLIRRFFGVVTWDEYRVASIQSQADSRFDDLRYLIVDLSGCRLAGPPVSDDELDEMAALAEVANHRWRPDFRFAVVADDPALQTMVNRYRASPFVVRSYELFEDFGVAHAWAAQAASV